MYRWPGSVQTCLVHQETAVIFPVCLCVIIGCQKHPINGDLHPDEQGYLGSLFLRTASPPQFRKFTLVQKRCPFRRNHAAWFGFWPFPSQREMVGTPHDTGLWRWDNVPGQPCRHQEKELVCYSIQHTVLRSPYMVKCISTGVIFQLLIGLSEKITPLEAREHSVQEAEPCPSSATPCRHQGRAPPSTSSTANFPSPKLTVTHELQPFHEISTSRYWIFSVVVVIFIGEAFKCFLSM